MEPWPLRDRTSIVGIGETQYWKAGGADRTEFELACEAVQRAVADAGLTLADVDGICVYSGERSSPSEVAQALGLGALRFVSLYPGGGNSACAVVHHAALAVASGSADVVVCYRSICQGQFGRFGRARVGSGTARAEVGESVGGREAFTMPSGLMSAAQSYALAAARHMHEYGTTSEQLAWIKVAAAAHAQHNPNAMLREPVTVEEVLASPMISDPLHKLDCCVVSDGGGALVVVRPEIAARLKRPVVNILGAGETIKGQLGGHVDLTWSGAAISGPIAFKEAGVSPADIQYASIYDSFTITVLMQLEDLGFCKKGEGGRFVADGNLISGVGTLPFNTDGGGLCNNHPANRGGITKVIEAVRQLRGEAHPKVQVPDCTLALAQGTGGSLGSRHGSATLIMERQ